MSATGSQSVDRMQELRTILTRVVRESTGMHEQLALPIADSICDELQRRYGGRQWYIHAPCASDRHQQIRDAAALGTPVQAICQRFGVARATVYRALSGVS